MVLSSLRLLVEKISAMLGINMNGLFTGIAVAIFLMWSNNQQKLLQPPPVKPRQPSDPENVASKPDDDAAAGDLNEVREGGRKGWHKLRNDNQSILWSMALPMSLAPVNPHLAY